MAKFQFTQFSMCDTLSGTADSKPLAHLQITSLSMTNYKIKNTKNPKKLKITI
jgi:hypothetical protein